MKQKEKERVMLAGEQFSRKKRLVEIQLLKQWWLNLTFYPIWLFFSKR